MHYYVLFCTKTKCLQFDSNIQHTAAVEDMAAHKTNFYTLQLFIKPNGSISIFLSIFFRRSMATEEAEKWNLIPIQFVLSTVFVNHFRQRKRDSHTYYWVQCTAHLIYYAIVPKSAHVLWKTTTSATSHSGNGQTMVKTTKKNNIGEKYEICIFS